MVRAMPFQSGTCSATVRSFDPELGWGVLDAVDTPGGCWVHWSVVQVDGYRSLEPGQKVTVDWEAGDQDGYRYRAVGVTV